MMVPMSLASSSGSPILSALTLRPSSIEEAVENVAMQEQARARGAGLALAGEAHGGDDAVDHPVFVGVGKDDRGALAAELERNRHDAIRGGAHDELADLGRAGEGELADRGMAGERRAAFLAVAGQHVEHARRQELLANFGQQQHAERRILGRLHHHRVAGAERRADLDRAEQHRRVPRNDGADHAERLAPRIAQHLLAERNGLALELTAQAAEIAEDVDRAFRLRPRLGADGVAGFERDRARKLLERALPAHRRSAPAAARVRAAPCATRPETLRPRP